VTEDQGGPGVVGRMQVGFGRAVRGVDFEDQA
jgi:hypothetical protein